MDDYSHETLNVVLVSMFFISLFLAIVSIFIGRTLAKKWEKLVDAHDQNEFASRWIIGKGEWKDQSRRRHEFDVDRLGKAVVDRFDRLDWRFRVIRVGILICTTLCFSSLASMSITRTQPPRDPKTAIRDLGIPDRFEIVESVDQRHVYVRDPETRNVCFFVHTMPSGSRTSLTYVPCEDLQK